MDKQASRALAAAVSRHDISQPLNVISMIVGTLRLRCIPQLPGTDAAYCEAKLQKIEEQIERAAKLLDRLPLAND